MNFKRLVFSSLFLLLFIPTSSFAAISSWQKAGIIVPQSPDDLGSETTKQSMAKLKATGANEVGLLVPWYQSNLGSTDIQRGWNTPTDGALGKAIDNAHALGLKAYVKVHIDSYTGDWRAGINPSDRATWFRNFDTILTQIATVSQAHNAEVLSLGTELVLMTNKNNPDNTVRWRALIAHMRQVFHGQLTYGANSTTNTGDTYHDEKRNIAFWQDLDFVSLSPYYSLDYGSNDVESLKRAWSYWNANDIQPFYASVQKPIFFGEIGYRSIQGSYSDPWNWERQGAPDQVTQANAYTALMDYWKDYPYFAGVAWWNWDSNPNAGGPNDNGFTPQGKTAETVMKQYFGGAPPPEPGVFSATGSNVTAQAGQSATIAATLSNSGGSQQNTIVDFEMYDAQNNRVLQKVYEGESLAKGTSKNYSFAWTPTQAGQYTVRVGVFSQGWSNLFHWNNSLLTVSATQTGTPAPVAIDIWWPTNGSTISGSQPFKALVQNKTLTEYDMFWQVDGGAQSPMEDSTVDWPHKEKIVGVSDWNWKRSGPYTINFIAKAKNSTIVLGNKSVNITVAR